MRDDDTGKKTLSVPVIAGAIIGLVALGAVAAYVVQMANQSAPVNVVVLKADQSDFKAKADAEDAPDSSADKSSVYNMLDELNETKDEVEILSLKPSSPELPEVKIEDAPATEKVAEAPQDTATETAVVEEAKPADAKPVQPQDAVTKAPESAEDEMTAALNKAEPATRPITKEVIEAKAKSGPSMMVQLAAFRDAGKAQTVASVLTQKHKDRLQGLSLGVMQIDTGSSGVFWRVITEPLPNEDARGLCDALKRAGQDCILRKVDLP